MWPSVKDLSRYVTLELNSGMLDGKKILSKESLFERRKPGVRISDSSRYGLGLFLEDYKGINVIGHDGKTLGFTAMLLFLPEQGLGLVLLTNASAANLFLQAVKQKFMELTFGESNKSADTIAFALRHEQQNRELLKSRVSTDSKSTAWIKRWVGTYFNDTLGKITIRASAKSNGFELDGGEWRAGLGTELDASGKKNLMLLLPSVFLVFQTDEKAGVLILDAGQQQYRFSKVKAIPKKRSP